MRDFTSETSRCAWELFKQTGNIGYYMLYANLEHPPKELQFTFEQEREL